MFFKYAFRHLKKIRAVFNQGISRKIFFKNIKITLKYNEKLKKMSIVKEPKYETMKCFQVVSNCFNTKQK